MFDFLAHSFYIAFILFFFQNQIRELEGIPVIAGLLSDPALEVRVQALNALNNLCMNIQNQEQIKVCCIMPQINFCT